MLLLSLLLAVALLLCHVHALAAESDASLHQATRSQIVKRAFEDASPTRPQRRQQSPSPYPTCEGSDGTLGFAIYQGALKSFSEGSLNPSGMNNGPLSVIGCDQFCNGFNNCIATTFVPDIAVLLGFSQARCLLYEQAFAMRQSTPGNYVSFKGRCSEYRAQVGAEFDAICCNA